MAFSCTCGEVLVGEDAICEACSGAHFRRFPAVEEADIMTTYPESTNTEDPILSCGHRRTPKGCAYGTATTPDGRSICVNCAETEELAEWATKPAIFLAYYDLPAERADMPRVYRDTFAPALTGGTVTTWIGSTLGQIVSARVSRHNFGGRMISIRVKGTNGADYYGRASYDRGTCINLRRCR